MPRRERTQVTARQQAELKQRLRRAKSAQTGRLLHAVSLYDAGQREDVEWADSTGSR